MIYLCDIKVLKKTTNRRKEGSKLITETFLFLKKTKSKTSFFFFFNKT